MEIKPWNLGFWFFTIPVFYVQFLSWGIAGLTAHNYHCPWLAPPKGPCSNTCYPRSRKSVRLGVTFHGVFYRRVPLPVANAKDVQIENANGVFWKQNARFRCFIFDLFCTILKYLFPPPPSSSPPLNNEKKTPCVISMKRNCSPTLQTSFSGTFLREMDDVKTIFFFFFASVLTLFTFSSHNATIILS